MSGRIRKRFDGGWKFLRGDEAEAWVPEFDATAWRDVDLPHDWSVEDLPPSTDPNARRSGPFDADAEGGGAQGFTIGGVGWYRKSFAIGEDMRGRRVNLDFDGVYMKAEVWVNGERVGERPYGYSSFGWDVTEFVRFGEDNVVAVKVDASGKSSRWFPGAGIYRHVWLTTTNGVHLEVSKIDTPEVTAEAATVAVRTGFANETYDAAEVTLASRIVDAKGNTVATAEDTKALPSGALDAFEQDMKVDAPQLWSPDSPTMYTLVSTLSVGGEVVDEVETPFGIRTFSFDAERGFVLNGEPLKLRGGDVHHDNGCLGACTYDRAEERRVELLKASGYNAIRTSHNPPSPAFLDACDRVGMIVMDEAFDCWQLEKSPFDYHLYFDEWWVLDVAGMVERDWNHPSVVMWSIGNELPEQGSPAYAAVGGKIVKMIRSMDPTRAISVGAHPGTDPWEALDDLFDQLDVVGYNYKPEKYEADHERRPKRVILGTESFPMKCFEHWMAVEDMPWVAGDFVWTAMDYLGESALGCTYFEGEEAGYQTWPWTVSNCGDLDLCGWKRPQSYYRDVVWRTGAKVSMFVQTPLPEGKTAEHVYGWGWPNVLASWTWPGMEAKALTVCVYSACERVRLELNGKEVGTKETGRETRFEATWDVPYEAGTLVAIGLDAEGKEVARWELKTAGAPARIRMTADRATVTADGQDLSFVTVELLDEQGVINPNAQDVVSFEIEGPGTIVGVGNGDPKSVESFQGKERKAYRGKVLAVVKAGAEAGEVRLKATAEGMKGAEVVVKVAGVSASEN